MPKPGKKEISFTQKLLLIKRAGLKNYRQPDVQDPHIEKLESIDERVNRIFRILNKYQITPAK